MRVLQINPLTNEPEFYKPTLSERHECQKGGGVSGGGGSSGLVEYPPHITNAHSSFLTYLGNFIGHIAGNLDGVSFPYADAIVYFPEPHMKKAVVGFLDWLDYLEELPNKFNLKAITDDAANVFEDHLGNDYIEEAVTEYERIQRIQHAKAAARMSGGLATIGAVQSSAYTLADAMLEADFQHLVGHYHAQLGLNITRDKAKAMAEMSNLSARMLSGYQDMLANYATAWAEMQKMYVISMKEYHEMEVIYDVKNIMWPLTPYKHGANMLGSVAGTAVSVPEDEVNPDKSGLAISGALGGAAAGAMLGSVIPGVGTLLGGAIGGIGGALMNA